MVSFFVLVLAALGFLLFDLIDGQGWDADKPDTPENPLEGTLTEADDKDPSDPPARPIVSGGDDRGALVRERLDADTEAVLEGRILSARGIPMIDAQVRISKVLPLEAGASVFSLLHTGEDGCFVVVRLDPGSSYKVWVSTSGGWIFAGTVELAGPGVTRKEFTLPLASISGFVTHGGNTLHDAKDLRLMLISDEHDEGGEPAAGSAVPDEKGSFLFTGLPAGFFRVQARSESLGNAQTESIVLHESEARDNLELCIPIGGRLCVHIMGEEQGGADQRLELKLKCHNPGFSYEIDRTIPSEVLSEADGHSIALEPGDFTVSLPGSGFPKQRVTIVENGTTDVTFHLLEEEMVHTTLSGKLMNEVLEPVDRACVMVIREGPEGERARFSAFTDREGSFEIGGLWQGTWVVTTYENEGACCLLGDLTVSENAEEKTEMVYELMKAGIKGKIIDGKSWKPIDHSRAWTLKLTRKGAQSTSVWGGTGSLFWYGNLEPGTYKIVVDHPDLGSGLIEGVTVNPSIVTEGLEVVVR